MKKKIIFIITFILVISSTGYVYSRFQIKDTKSSSITVPENNYCINNGFTKLSDCMLVMENFSDSVSSAKSYISNKDSADVNHSAPTLKYKIITNSVTEKDVATLITKAHFTLGQSYTFDEVSGMYTLVNYTNKPLNDNYIGYYTCGGTTGSYKTCANIYKVNSYKIINEDDGSTTYKITNATRYSYNTVDSLDSQVGLYSTSDDDGTSYFYRGNVLNNYVSYAGFIWRIVRENGDGSVRLIYSGTSTSDTGKNVTIGSTKFNPYNYDPIFESYNYQPNFEVKKQDDSSTFTKIYENQVYNFGSSYRFDENTGLFSLSGDVITGKWSDVKDTAIASYPYVCFQDQSSDSCNWIAKVIGKTSSNPSAIISRITYGTKDYDSLFKTGTSSSLKTKIDNWYSSNILGKSDSNGVLYSDYLTDSTFCSDLNIEDSSSFSTFTDLFFGPYRRLHSSNSTITSTLKCNSNSRYTVSNGKLTYPVATINADETSFAGGINGSVNTNFYLNIGSTYWTMSPYFYQSNDMIGKAGNVTSNGIISANIITNEYYARPVVNLSKNVKISGGDGTQNNPYIVYNS